MMNLKFWIYLWKLTLILGLSIFIIMFIWVTINGYKDLRSLLSQKEKNI